MCNIYVMYLDCDIMNAAPIVRYGHDTNMPLCIHTSKLLRKALATAALRRAYDDAAHDVALHAAIFNFYFS